jgi:hypothetical protein
VCGTKKCCLFRDFRLNLCEDASQKKNKSEPEVRREEEEENAKVALQRANEGLTVALLTRERNKFKEGE